MAKVTRRELLGWFGLTAMSAALPSATGCLPSGKLKRPLNMRPHQLEDGWELSSVEASGLDPKRLVAMYERVFSEDEFINALSLLVVKQGTLVAEGYTQSASDATRKEHIQSVTKSLTSLALGIARSDGYFTDLDSPISHYVNVQGKEKRLITLRHLLTMRSGIGVDNDEFNVQIAMRMQQDVTRWLLDQPLTDTPGKRFDYRDCDPQLLGGIFLRETKSSIEQVVRRRIFQPLGIRNVRWQHTTDDEPFAANGVWLSPRDLAKIGELVRRRGDWKGQPLVPSDWIDLATRKQTPVAAAQQAAGLAYGYYFWVVPELGWTSTWGHGGQFMLVIPEHELVLVMTSMPDAGTEIGTELPDFVELARELLDV